MVAERTTRWHDRAVDARLPLWLRIAAYAEAHADDHGHARLTTSELTTALGPTTPSTISRAIATAVTVGWLAPTSSARCLVTIGCEHEPCPATHRERTTTQ